MEELYFDYNKYKTLTLKRKRLFRGFGIFFLGVSIYLLIVELGSGAESLAMLISGFLNLLMGILFFAQSYNLRAFYPRNYLRVNEEFIAYKLWIFRKPVKIPWNSVIVLHKRPSDLVFLMDDSRQFHLETKFLPSSDVKRIVPRIDSLARQKRVEVIKD